MALREQVRKPVRGDVHGHVQCVKKKTEEDQRSCWRAVFVRGGLEAKVKQQAAEGVKGGVRFGGNFCAPEIVNVVGAVKAERAEHVRDCGRGALAHHSGRAEAKGRRNVKIEKTIVAETEEAVVAGIDA